MFSNIPSYRSARPNGLEWPRDALLDVSSLLLILIRAVLCVASLSICGPKTFHNTTDCGLIAYSFIIDDSHGF